MILADKIIMLRKKSGWSQEELAVQLGVTRQSVSKWEGAQSVPDMDKVVQLSRLFGVSTDFLLKDELEVQETLSAHDETALRRVSMEQAARYLTLQRENAPRMALATLLCVLSPICLLFFAAASEYARFPLGEDAAAGLGVIVLLLLVAAGVALFLLCAARVKEFDFLEKEPFETEYGVTGMVRARRHDYEPTHTRRTVLGTLLCILALVPLFAAACLGGADILYVCAVCALLALAGLGAMLFVLDGVYYGAMDKLLEEGDYTRVSKARSDLFGTLTLIYWLCVTALFLFLSFGPGGNGQPGDYWLVWAIGGVLYAAVMGVVTLVLRGRKG